MHGKHVTIVDVGRVVRIQNLIRYEANTGFSNAEKPVLKPNRKTGSSGFFHTGTQPYYYRIYSPETTCGESITFRMLV